MKDIKLNETLTDLDESLEATEAGVQTMAMLANTAPGEWKASPLDGLEVEKYLSAPTPKVRALRNKSQEAMERNGIEGAAKVENGKLTITIND